MSNIVSKFLNIEHVVIFRVYMFEWRLFLYLVAVGWCQIIYLFIYLFNYLFILLFIYLLVYLLSSLFEYLFHYLFICLLLWNIYIENKH